MLRNSWIVGLVVLAAVIGAIFGATFGFSRTNYAQSMMGGRDGRPEFRNEAAMDEAPSGDEAQFGQENQRGPGGRGGHNHTDFSFGRGLAGVVGSLIKLALMVAVVVWLWPQISRWWNQRGGGGGGNAIPPHKEEPPVVVEGEGV
ncbi:MAG: hypothetical protein OT477_03045 [Chloroflexi bacterium]|nr:hypothetical protein [Chloroflexota bacterium]